MQSDTHKTRLVSQAQKDDESYRFRLTPLTHSIRLLIALAGFTFVSSASCDDVHINPNEMWLAPGRLTGICAQDIDQDGDIDLFKIHSVGVSMLENIGIPMYSEYPEFSPPIAFSNDTGNLNLNRLGLYDCQFYSSAYSLSVDIDADGDLDLFTQPKDGEYARDFEYARNDGTTEHPVYVKEDPQELFGLPLNRPNGFMFKDLDYDGDKDFFSYSRPFFYENIGTLEQATYVQRTEYPLQYHCASREFLIDLNNDGQWDALCINNSENTIEFLQTDIKISTAYLPKPINADNSKTFQKVQVLDIDQDGDIDIIGVSKNNYVLYLNIGTRLSPKFNKGSTYKKPFEFSAALQHLSDLDSDGDVDAIGYNYNKTSTHSIITLLSYAINSGSSRKPVFEASLTSAEFLQCNQTLKEFSHRIVEIQSINFVDLDGDNDLDLFTRVLLDEGISSDNNGETINFYCENQGNAVNPIFARGIVNPFGLKSGAYGLEPPSLFGDIDGDGDQDVQIDNLSYENIGNIKQPLFRQTSNSSIFVSNSISALVDIDGDGQVDSILDTSKGLRLLYKSLEPISYLAATSIDNDLILATMRISQIQLQRCSLTKFDGCRDTFVLAMTARELSLSTGDFNADGSEDIVLAMIDSEGILKTLIYNSSFQLIGSGTGGIANSVSVSAGQLDDDLADEYVVSFVQPDGNIATIAFNLDSSQVGKAIAGLGKHPSVDIGKFNHKGNSYVLAFFNSNDQFETATFDGSGILIAQGYGELSSHVTVHAVDLLSNNSTDEYVTSLIQSDGTAALIGFTAGGKRLGKVVGGVSQQPNVTSGNFPGPNDIGIAATLIQSDQKPAIIFLDNLGNFLAAGIGSKSALKSSITLVDTDGDGIDEGVLIYIDEAGIPHWEIFDANGIKK